MGLEGAGTDPAGAGSARGEDRYRNFFEAGLVGMAITVPDKHWGEFNQRLCRMLGYSADELAQRTWAELTHPDDLAADVAQFERLMAGDTDGYELDKRFIRKDGQVLHAAISVRCERDAGGAALRFYATIEDLSARKLAERALHENQQRLQALLDNISCGVIVHAADSRIVDANPAACRVTGLSLDQMLGREAMDPVWCFVEEDGSVMAHERYPVPQVLARGGPVNKFVLGVRRADLPQPVWVQVDAYPFRDEAGRIEQIVVTFADITELKMAEAGARRLNRSLRVLSSGNAATTERLDEDAYLDAVCRAVVDAGSYRLAWIGTADEARGGAVRVLARAGHEDGYLDAIELSADPTQPNGQGPWGRAMRSGLVQVNRDWSSADFVVPWRDEALRRGYLSSVALPLKIGERVFAVLSLYAAQRDAFSPEELPPLEELARNVSVAVESLRTRRERDEAQGANRAKSEFLANMSHEMRTPLNAIVGLNYLLRRDGVTPQQADRLHKIETASQHLLSLINDLLDLSKIEAGQVRLESADFHLPSLLESVASLIGESARAKGLQVTTDSEGVPAWLRGDPTRLRQALLNYAGNAVKFTERGHIALRARVLETGGDRLVLRFTVEDTGIGIAAEHIPRLFQSFEQVDVSITRQFGGTGLGLAITRRLTELMGGRCGVDSHPGKGSCFWFTVTLGYGHAPPPAPAAVPTTTARQRLRLRHAGTRILVAEDNEVNQEVLLAMLEGVGLEAVVTANGREAVERAAAADCALALMDVQMPVMSGLEATRTMRGLAAWGSRPILALTANAFEEDRRACEAAGMDDFIVKPVDAEGLYETLLQWLGRGSPEPVAQA